VGVLYAGIMVIHGDPFLLEINVRFGDPETQPVLMRMKSDLLQIMNAAVTGGLSGYQIDWNPQPSVCVVAASGGYPAKYRKGLPISGLESFDNATDAVIFHAGTAWRENEIVTAGGRVLGITALGKTIQDAKSRAYEIINSIYFEDVYYRNDIAWRAIDR